MIQLKNELRTEMLPYQVGVAVPGGLEIVNTLVDILMEDPDAVLASMDIKNCFNAFERLEMIEEIVMPNAGGRVSCLAKLGKYLLMSYFEHGGATGWVWQADAKHPKGGKWKGLSAESGVHQGRPAGPAIAAALLLRCFRAVQPILDKADREEGVQARDTSACVGYLDDAVCISKIKGAAKRVIGPFVRGWTAALKTCGWEACVEKSVLAAARLWKSKQADEGEAWIPSIGQRRDEHTMEREEHQTTEFQQGDTMREFIIDTQPTGTFSKGQMEPTTGSKGNRDQRQEGLDPSLERLLDEMLPATKGFIYLGTPATAPPVLGPGCQPAPTPVMYKRRGEKNEVPHGPREYKAGVALRMVKDHDRRNHAIIRFVQDADTEHQGTLRLQMAIHCIRWSSNNRNIHLLRGLDPETSKEAAAYHDRAIMATTAACLRKLKIEKNEPLGEVNIERIDPYFRESWGMAVQGFQQGGINIRPWAAYAKAAMLGKASLVISSSRFENEEGEGCHYPVIKAATMAAVNDDQRMPDHESCPAGTLTYTWSLNQTWHDQLAVATRNNRGIAPAWIRNTRAKLQNIGDAGERAQRLFSKTTTTDIAVKWARNIADNPRLKACQIRAKGAGESLWLAMAWQEDGHLNCNQEVILINYYIRFGIPLPENWRGYNSGIQDPDIYGYTLLAHTKSTGAWNIAHNQVQTQIMHMLHNIGSTDIKKEDNEWDTRTEAQGNAQRRKPDIVATLPTSSDNIVIEIGGSWKEIGKAGSTQPGQAANEVEERKTKEYERALEVQKERRRSEAQQKAQRMGQEMETHLEPTDTLHVAGFECTGAMGKEFKNLIGTCARESRVHTTGADLYHWSCMSFIRHWKTRFAVAIARGLAHAITKEGKRSFAQHEREGRGETEQYGQ